MQRGRALGHDVLEAVAAVRYVLHSGLDGAHDGADGVHAQPLHAAWAAAAARLRTRGEAGCWIIIESSAKALASLSHCAHCCTLPSCAHDNTDDYHYSVSSMWTPWQALS